MRRKTVQLDTGLTERTRNFKNKSYIWAKGIVKPIVKKKKFVNASPSAQTVATLFLEDLMDSLDPLFRKIDQKINDYYLSTMITTMEGELDKIMNPIKCSSLAFEDLAYPEEEPESVSTDWICGGKIGHTAKRASSKHTLSVLSTDRIKDVPKSKNNILSSKCLMKVAKEQQLQRRRSLEALKLENEEAVDRHQQLMKEKIAKLTKQTMGNIVFKTLYNEKNSKFNNTISNLEEFSYDYDGTAIPLRKIGHRLPDKVHVLNTLCKVNKQDATAPNKKRHFRGKPYHCLKTEADSCSRENLIPHISKLVEARKESFLKSVNELKGLSCRGGEEDELRNKLNEFGRTRAVKIRELNN